MFLAREMPGSAPRYSVAVRQAIGCQVCETDTKDSQCSGDIGQRVGLVPMELLVRFGTTTARLMLAMCPGRLIYMITKSFVAYSPHNPS